MSLDDFEEEDLEAEMDEMYQFDDEEEMMPLLLAYSVCHGYRYWLSLPRSRKRSRLGPDSRLHLTFDNVTSVYDDVGFRRAFRMNRQTFQTLLTLIREDISRNEEMGMRAGRPVVAPDTRLAVTLRMLAGASYSDIQASYHVGRSTLYEVFKTTCNALMKRLQLPGLPQTEGEMQKSEMMFRKSRPSVNPLSGCLGALDGICVKIKKPKECERPASFYCRKGYYALPVQALCDSSYRFLCFSARCVGSTHDAMAHAVSSLGMYLSEVGLPEAFWIAGDEAYTCNENLITPYPASQSGPEERNFNFFLSVHRVHIEQAFGQLVARWRILRDGLEYSLSRNARIICLCMKLHNFCIDNDERQFSSTLSNIEKAKAIAESQLWYQESKETLKQELHGEEAARPRSSSLSEKRDLLREYVKVSGLQRPALTGVPTGDI